MTNQVQVQGTFQFFDILLSMLEISFYLKKIKKTSVEYLLNNMNG